MRRLALIGVVLVAAVAALGASSSPSKHRSYDVRAIFDDAAFAVPGENVRIAGAPVGSIKSLDVTSDKKAAVTLSITDSRFTPFYANATCAIRPQSLIGERYVNCSPGSSSSAPLRRIASGPGAGTYYLPVTQTSSPIDFDIVQDISQQPVRDSFALILNELGTGLAARGSDLNAVIHRANPALGYTDQVFQILARQNRQLAQLATDSDAVLTPLAQDRRAISDFVVQANTTSVASAARANDIARSFQLFPSFLRQLKPLLADLGTLADQGTPLMTELSQSAAAVGRQFTNLAPFARAARSSLIDLGNSFAQSQPALLKTIPLDQRLLALGNATEPTAVLLDRLLSSLDQTGGIEQLMKVLFYGTTAGNGFDQFGHYARDELLTNGNCVQYATSASASPICSVLFSATGSGSGTAAVASSPAAGISKVDRVAVQAARAVRPKRFSSGPLRGLLRYLIGNQR